jgi:hypothetical protein
MGNRLAKVALASALSALALGAVAVIAHAELAQKGVLRVAFNGGIAPQKLPRTEPAPVTVRVGGKIGTADRSTPPKLKRIRIAVNSNGRLQSKGLGTCALAELNSASSAQAERSCADALIGHGNVTSRVTLPGQGAFASNGPLLAFNAHYKGHEAIFAQVASGAPLPLTYVIVFEVKRVGGRFGTELIGTLPRIASEYGYISAFNLSLGRTYPYKGKTLSYASASCPAPAGFPGASFAFAEASYEFSDETTLSATLNRDCKVRGE